MTVGLVSGTSVSRSAFFRSWEEISRQTAHGEVHGRRYGDLVALNRHGPGGTVPPHAVNHRANIRFFADLGVDEIISLSSVGSLREDLAPGAIVSCGDYVSFRPMTFQQQEMRPVTPRVDNAMIPEITRACGFAVETGCVYVQMPGPRFETRAEIRVIRHWGDVVGMTMANEADLCAEVGIGFNSVAVVDNFAHGILDRPVTAEIFRRQVGENQSRVDRLLEVFARLFGGNGRVRDEKT